MERINIINLQQADLSAYMYKDILVIKDMTEYRNMQLDELLVEGFLISLTTAGNARVKIDEHVTNLSVGDLFVCKPRNVMEQASMSSDYNSYLLFISPRLAQELYRLVNVSVSIKSMAQSHAMIHLQDEHVMRMRMYLDLLCDIILRPGDMHTQESIKMLLASMSYYLHDLREPDVAAPSFHSYSSAENIMQRFVNMLHDVNTPLQNVNEYSALLNVTPKYFSSICKRITGRSASQIITAETLKRATILLRDNSLSIKQISAMLNFHNQSHFGRYFRNHMGVSPIHYRNRNQSNS